jgi:hypothetical protein
MFQTGEQANLFPPIAESLPPHFYGSWMEYWKIHAASRHEIEIKIDKFNFVPVTMTVAAGTRVTWTNEGRRAAHGGERRHENLQI